MSKFPKKQSPQQFLALAKPQADLQAIALVGPAMRVDHPADEWSDVDLVVVSSDPQIYLSATDWLTAMGNP